MKIQIIGYSGSGKSTLAKRLGRFYGIPHLHLDAIQFYGNWQERSKEEQRDRVERFLSENESWVIDGNYSSIVPRRFEQSDITVFLSYNRIFCYFMCMRRYRLHKNSPRESCPCNEKFDFEFQKWILFDGRTRARREKHISNLNKTSGEKLVFKSRRSLEKWLKGIGCPPLSDEDKKA